MLLDTLQRPLRNLRLSVTDRCNLRCQYCMPEAEYTWLPKQDLLTFEEIDRLVGVFVGLGVDKLRLTGGEPLLRTNLPALVRQLARHAAVRDLALTTNGILLAPLAPALKAAGLGRVTVSLDTLRRDRFIALARQDELPRTLAGIDTAARDFPGFKIDTVVIRGVNDDEIADAGRVRARTRRRDPLHRVHGRRRRHRLDGGAGRCHARRSSSASPTRSGDRPGVEGAVGAGRPLPAARRHAVRRHRLDHRAVLPRLRPRAAHGGRRPLPVPLRDARAGSAGAAARRRE